MSLQNDIYELVCVVLRYAVAFALGFCLGAIA